MKILALLLAVGFSFGLLQETSACGHKKFEVKTEVEIDGQKSSPSFVVLENETATATTNLEASNETTGVQVLAQELWDETYQGDAVRLQFKVFKNQGRRSILVEDFVVIVPFGQTVEKKITPNLKTSTAKSLRFKVTAKKI